MGLRADLQSLRDVNGIFIFPGSHTAEGDIATTFLALQIAPDMFAGPPARTTLQIMRDDLQIGGQLDEITRLKAIAIMRAAGGSDWREHGGEIRQSLSTLGTTPVTEGSLTPTLELIDVLRTLEPDVPRPVLQLFDARDPRTRQLARLAIANADVFANEENIRTHFHTIVERLEGEAIHPGEPLVTYYTAINAVAGAGIQPDPGTHRQIVAALRTVQGCTLNGVEHPYLFRASASTSESCSLAATWQAVRSGFAFEGTQ